MRPPICQRHDAAPRCRFIGQSGVIESTVKALTSTTNTALVAAYMHVLLQFSYLADNARQLLDSTHLLTLIPPVLAACNATLTSPLIPIAVDLLWNVLDRMDSPRILPARSPSERPSQRLSGTVLSQRPSTTCSTLPEDGSGVHAEPRARSSVGRQRSIARTDSREGSSSRSPRRTLSRGKSRVARRSDTLTGTAGAPAAAATPERRMTATELLRSMTRSSRDRVSAAQMLSNEKVGLESIVDHPENFTAPEFSNAIRTRRTDSQRACLLSPMHHSRCVGPCSSVMKALVRYTCTHVRNALVTRAHC